jgi:acyl carrier protein
MVSKQEIFTAIREILKKNLEIDTSALGEKDQLAGGPVVSLDSMEFMELAFSLEQKYDVPFDEETVNLHEVMVSMDTIADYIINQIQGKVNV